MDEAEIDRNCDALLDAGADPKLVKIQRANMHYQRVLVETGVASKDEAFEMIRAGLDRLKAMRVSAAIGRWRAGECFGSEIKNEAFENQISDARCALD